ncbi:MAG: FAD-dependent oxidoreductase, partial [Planctomycetota bacterium]
MKEIEGYDVVVVGGGPGGIGAAVAAGRSGAKTLLIEREGCLGGGMTTMFVHPFMSEFTRCDENTPRRVVNAGLFSELKDRMVARGAMNVRKEGGPRFDDEPMKLVLD